MNLPIWCLRQIDVCVCVCVLLLQINVLRWWPPFVRRRTTGYILLDGTVSPKGRGSFCPFLERLCEKMSEVLIREVREGGPRGSVDMSPVWLRGIEKVSVCTHGVSCFEGQSPVQR